MTIKLGADLGLVYDGDDVMREGVYSIEFLARSTGDEVEVDDICVCYVHTPDEKEYNLVEVPGKIFKKKVPNPNFKDEIVDEAGSPAFSDWVQSQIDSEIERSRDRLDEEYYANGGRWE